jgi:hypothetical protein
MPSSQQALMEATKKRARRLEAKGKPVHFKELLRMDARFWNHQHPEREVQALDAVAGSEAPLRGAVQLVQ